VSGAAAASGVYDGSDAAGVSEEGTCSVDEDGAGASPAGVEDGETGEAREKSGSAEVGFMGAPEDSTKVGFIGAPEEW